MGRLWSRLRLRTDGEPTPQDTYNHVQWLDTTALHDLWDMEPPADFSSHDDQADELASLFDREWAEIGTGAPLVAAPFARRTPPPATPPSQAQQALASPHPLLPTPTASNRDQHQELLRRRMEVTGRRLKPDVDDVPNTPHIAESEIRSAMALYLAGEGFHIHRPKTRSRRVFPSLAAFRADKELWIACRGYPGQEIGVSPAELGRQWLAVAILDLIRYRSADETIELGLALPNVRTFRRLVDDAEWALKALGVTLWWVADNNTVRPHADTSLYHDPDEAAATSPSAAARAIPKNPPLSKSGARRRSSQMDAPL